MKRAIISVSDKTGIEAFAKELQALSFEIYSTGGTLKLLQDNGVNALSISELTQFPEILNGRVKTLHPMVHGGILADKQNPEHVAACEEHKITLIDLVVVNLYPFEETVAQPNVTEAEAIEKIDIGGPTLIRAAAKNFNSTAVVTNPEDYEQIIQNLKDYKGVLPVEQRRQLAMKAFKRVTEYDTAISTYFSEAGNNEMALPTNIEHSLEKITDLRYGENPHQQAALYKNKNQSQPNFKQLHGKELSYNNFLDIDAAISIVQEFSVPGAVVIKHTNPCGAAIADSLEEAYQKAHDADPLSAFGSIVGLNRSVDLKTAKALSKTFIEVIIAPSFEAESLEILTKKANIRLIEMPMNSVAKTKLAVKELQGAYLVQTIDNKQVSRSVFNCVTDNAPNAKQENDLEFAFTLVKYIKSNAIVIVKDGQTLGVGAGQMSRVDSVEIALKKAGNKAKGAVLASDAFFPFKDSIDVSAKYGIAAVVQPGGSKRDEESIDACNEHKMSMVFTGSRHFKH